MKNLTQGRYFKQERTRVYPDGRQDTYRETKKHEEPTICRACGSLFTNGRWTWDEIPEHANEATCPACKRIHDRFPAGIVTLSGLFLNEHKEEILNMVHNICKLEVSEHPLERLMEINEELKDQIIIKTTGTHLARRIGDAVRRAYQGALDYSYDGEDFLRIGWRREAD